MKRAIGSICLISQALVGSAAVAQEVLPKTHFQVIGNHSTNNTYKMGEEPFWTEVVPEKSEGQITADLTPLDASGLAGPEVFRLMRLDSLQFATGVLAYMAGDNAEFLAVDLPGLSTSLEQTKEITEVFRPLWEDIAGSTYNTKILALFPSPPQVFWCKPEVRSLADLKGKTVRVSTVAQAQMVSEFGGATVNTPFPEVPTALERGVIDCGVTGTLAGNLAGWHEVTDYLYPMTMGWSLQFIAVNSRFWKSLDTDVQDFMMEQYANLENDLWNIIEEDVNQGIDCNIGAESCTRGNKADMVLVEVSEVDAAKQAKILSDIIIPDWLSECGEECNELFSTIER